MKASLLYHRRRQSSFLPSVGSLLLQMLVAALQVHPCRGFFMIWPFLQCNLALLFFDFDVLNFEEYPRYFKDDSTITLLQAGTYTGAEDIEEYVKFAVDETSPFVKLGPDQIETVEYIGYNWKEGLCEHLVYFEVFYTLDEQFTKEEKSFKTVVTFKSYFDYYDSYFQEISVFYFDGFLSFFFGDSLDSDKTRDYVCDVYEGACADEITQVDDCRGQLAELPLVGDGTSFRANDQGCRKLHAVFAETNLKHCAHISFEPKLDNKGRFICQDIEDEEPTTEGKQLGTFTADELQSIRDFASSVGVDPDEGLTFL